MAERERWILWLPVMVGLGVGLYFALPVEPPLWLGWALMLGAGLVLWLARRHWASWCAMCALFGIALGFAMANQRGHFVAGPVLTQPSGAIHLEGRIIEIEPLDQGERLLLDRLYLDSPGTKVPVRVRLKINQGSGGQNIGEDLRLGQWIGARVLLMPPPTPVAPGGFDFGRQAWFQQIGAVGSVIGQPEVLESPEGTGWSDRAALGLANLRHALTRRIVTAIDGAGFEPGIAAVAAAIVTAERGPIPPDLLNAYRNAGLAHILVIGGMHMSMVAGLVFVVLRGLLAAIPPLALRYPIKKWTAGAALAVTGGYLMVSGAPIPTERAFIMNAIVLAAVLVDREAISLRSIGLAGLAILLTRPEAVTGPSFQMSFAAVIGLISGYEALGPIVRRWHSGPKRWWARPLPYIGGILLTTLIAGTATAPYTVFHFNRYASFSLLGNALAVPVVGFWIMPAALLAMALLPFGLDGWGWHLMGSGIAVVDHIARAVNGLPGATIDMPQIPAGALALFTLGALWLCLWQQRWRLFGLGGIAAGILIYALSPPPDLLINATGRAMAARAADGGLALVYSGKSKMERENWARLSGQGTELRDWPVEVDETKPCDGGQCMIKVAGHLVGLARHKDSLAELCNQADLVVTLFATSDFCPSAKTLINGPDLARAGPIAAWLTPGHIRIETVAEWRGNRPWAQPPEPRQYHQQRSQRYARAGSLNNAAAIPPGDPEP